ncbi:hypothetical protein N9L68_00325 [bacterium]|nr:hypothetical protein [bacterium]
MEGDYMHQCDVRGTIPGATQADNGLLRPTLLGVGALSGHVVVVVVG